MTESKILNKLKSLIDENIAYDAYALYVHGSKHVGKNLKNSNKLLFTYCYQAYCAKNMIVDPVYLGSLFGLDRNASAVCTTNALVDSSVYLSKYIQLINEFVLINGESIEKIEELAEKVDSKPTPYKSNTSALACIMCIIDLSEYKKEISTIAKKENISITSLKSCIKSIKEMFVI